MRDAYYAYGGAAETDLFLMLGDNAYEHGTHAEYQAAVFDMYPEHPAPYAALADLRQPRRPHRLLDISGWAPYYDIFMLPREGEAGGVASGTEAYYSFDYGNIHFVCLNSYDVSRAPEVRC